MKFIKLYRLGLIDYQAAHLIQEKLRKAIIEGKTVDSLLLLEHPPTLTLGKSGDRENLLVSAQELARKGISIFGSDRGGNITWHGPGQVVCYPIIDLKKRSCDLHQLMFDYQEVIIRTLKEYSVNAQRDPKYIGVWVGSDKIAAMGINVRKWVTKHGFSLNVKVDLSNYSLINPCGIKDKGVTSLYEILGQEVAIKTIEEQIIDHFSRVFACKVIANPTYNLEEF